MKTAVQRWGNSLALRIPKAFAQQAGVVKDAPVDLSLEKGRIIVIPRPPARVSLKKLLARVTPNNMHAETSWGPPMGIEQG